MNMQDNLRLGLRRAEQPVGNGRACSASVNRAGITVAGVVGLAALLRMVFSLMGIVLQWCQRVRMYANSVRNAAGFATQQTGAHALDRAHLIAHILWIGDSPIKRWR